MEKIILFLIAKTFLGRGEFRKFLVYFLVNFILKKKFRSGETPYVITEINNVPFKCYFDDRTLTSKMSSRKDIKEIDFLKKHISEDFVFVDIGANEGYYSQTILADLLGYRSSKVISVEPNPLMIERIEENIKLLKSKKNFSNVNAIFVLEKCAVGKYDNTAFLNDTTYYGSASISDVSEQGIKVKIRPLVDILKSNNVTSVDALKIDVEGYEFEALSSFFREENKKLFPKRMVIEFIHNHKWENVNFYDDLINLYEYELVAKTSENLLLQLK